MNKVIYKYPVKLKTAMPRNAEVVKVGVQGGELFIWALTLQNEPLVERNFVAFGTGHAIPMSARYLGTVFDDQFVWHIVELAGE